MSKVSEIKQRAIELSEKQKRVAASLTTYSRSFDKLISEITNSIGDTATGADRDSIENIKKVKKSVADAVTALTHASKETRDWANNL